MDGPRARRMLEDRDWASIRAMTIAEGRAFVRAVAEAFAADGTADFDRLLALGNDLAVRGRDEGDEVLVAWCEGDAVPNRVDVAATILSTRWAQQEGGRAPDAALVARFAALVVPGRLPAAELVNAVAALSVAGRWFEGDDPAYAETRRAVGAALRRALGAPDVVEASPPGTLEGPRAMAAKFLT